MMSNSDRAGVIVTVPSIIFALLFKSINCNPSGEFIGTIYIYKYKHLYQKKEKKNTFSYHLLYI